MDPLSSFATMAGPESPGGPDLAGLLGAFEDMFFAPSRAVAQTATDLGRGNLIGAGLSLGSAALAGIPAFRAMPGGLMAKLGAGLMAGGQMAGLTQLGREYLMTPEAEREAGKPHLGLAGDLLLDPRLWGGMMAGPTAAPLIARAVRSRMGGAAEGLGREAAGGAAGSAGRAGVGAYDPYEEMARAFHSYRPEGPGPDTELFEALARAQPLREGMDQAVAGMAQPQVKSPLEALLTPGALPPVLPSRPNVVPGGPPSLDELLSRMATPEAPPGMGFGDMAPMMAGAGGLGHMAEAPSYMLGPQPAVQDVVRDVAERGPQASAADLASLLGAERAFGPRGVASWGPPPIPVPPPAPQMGAALRGESVVPAADAKLARKAAFMDELRLAKERRAVAKEKFSKGGRGSAAATDEIADPAMPPKEIAKMIVGHQQDYGTLGKSLEELVGPEAVSHWSGYVADTQSRPSAKKLRDWFLSHPDKVGRLYEDDFEGWLGDLMSLLEKRHPDIRRKSGNKVKDMGDRIVREMGNATENYGD